MKQKNAPLPSLRAKRRNPEKSQMYCHVANAPRNGDEQGNALIFILIAIALLGLLTVTLSRSGGSSNDTGSFEQNQIAASEILAYAKSIENAVQSLLARGCGENEISFENDTVAGYTNANSPADKSCHVFDVVGAGMTYQAPNNNWLDSTQSAKSGYSNYLFSGSNGVTNVATDNSKDLLFFFPYLKSDICTAINNLTKVQFTNIPDDNDVTLGVNFQGGFSGLVAGSTRIEGELNGSELSGVTTACFIETGGCAGSACYNAYHVLHAR